MSPLKAAVTHFAQARSLAFYSPSEGDDSGASSENGDLVSMFLPNERSSWKPLSLRAD